MPSVILANITMADNNGTGKIRELQLREIRRKIDAAWASLERGDGIEGTDFFECLEREERGLRSSE
ncbi:MAG: hypothetical protein ABSE85_10050 [Candidatus Korobacteraceae bacterium]